MRKKEIALELFEILVELEGNDHTSESGPVVRLDILAQTLASEAGWDWERDTAYVQWCATATQLEIAKENLKRFTSFCEL